VIASYTDMIAIYRAAFEHDIDRHDIARAQLTGWAEASNRALAIRDRHDPAQHQYSTEETGLTERQIRDAFGPYLERYFPTLLK
jgi:hypothetical protein